MVKSIIPLLFLMVMAMKSKWGDDVYDDPGMSTSGGGTQRGVMVRIMIEKQPNKWPSLLWITDLGIAWLCQTNQIGCVQFCSIFWGLNL